MAHRKWIETKQQPGTSWARQHAWLLLNSFPFPVGLPMCADCMHAPNPSVQFLGVQHSSSADFFLPPILILFFPQPKFGSIKSTSNFTRPLKIAEIRKRSFHAESNIIDGRPTCTWIWLKSPSLSRSILSFLSPIEAPKMSITLRKWKREAVFRSVREFLPLPSQSPIEHMPRKRGSSKDHYNNTSMPTLSRISSYASKEDYSARAQDGPQEREII